MNENIIQLVRLTRIKLYTASQTHLYKTLNLSPNISRSHSYKLSKLLCTIDATKFDFTNRMVNVWNRLPNSITLLFLQQLLFLKKTARY